VTETYHIVPPKLGPIAGLAAAMSFLSFIVWLRFNLGAEFPWLLIGIAALLVLLAVQCVGRILPGSPTDYLEVGPDGLTVGGLFGRRHRRWADVERFSAFLFPLSIVHVKAVSRRRSLSNVGFSLGGYVKLGWFDDIQERQRDISDWFENVKAAYRGGNHSGTLPPLPDYFVGQSYSVIERR